MIGVDRRGILGAAAALPLLALSGRVGAAMPAVGHLDALADLADLTTGVARIGAAEHRARIARAQGLMAARGIGAVLIEPGASLVYFTDIDWHRSERLTAAVLPVEGAPLIVTPFFEAPSVRQTLAIDAEVRVWQEDADPLALIAAFLRERRLAALPLAIEETVRFFAVDRLRHLMPTLPIVSADPVVRACRMIKTAAELALMQAAANVTVAAYRWVHPRIAKGMTAAQIGDLMTAATARLGGQPEFALVLIGEAAAYPHGSRAPQVVSDGAIVLMDCGCSVGGYQSDISRTFVFGGATAEQRRVWDHVAAGQRTAFAAAQIGVAAGSVDDAVRRFYATLGYGPGYRLPGLSHRTGHGIGLDGHEPVNLVHGEVTPLAPGMCFSNEPGLYLPGKFGVRLEDCFYLTAAGPAWFSTPPSSIDLPVT